MPNPTWASIIQNDEEVDQVILPRPSVIQKGAGITETISYKSEEDPATGRTKYYKATECSRTITVRRRISKAALRRQGLEKFGECNGQKSGELERGITEQCREPVLFEWEHERQEDDEDEDNVFARIVNRSQQETLLSEIIPDFMRQEKTESQKKRRPISSRFGRRLPNVTEMEDTPTIRLLDIPRNTTFQDLLDLVKGFHSRRIKLPRDHECPDHKNRGFAFITFDSHDAAERAKKALNGHPYGTNILHAEWSRNYANYMNADAETKRKVAGSGDSMFGGGRPGGRPRFTNSKKQVKPTPV